jgi:hypothetical protein
MIALWASLLADIITKPRHLHLHLHQKKATQPDHSDWVALLLLQSLL